MGPNVRHTEPLTATKRSLMFSSFYSQCAQKRHICLILIFLIILVKLRQALYSLKANSWSESTMALLRLAPSPALHPEPRSHGRRSTHRLPPQAARLARNAASADSLGPTRPALRKPHLSCFAHRLHTSSASNVPGAARLGAPTPGRTPGSCSPLRSLTSPLKK